MRTLLMLLLALVGLAGPVTAQGTIFMETCLASRDILSMARNDPNAQQELCACVEQDFLTHLDPDDMDRLRRDLSGELTDAERSEPRYAPISNYAGSTMATCLAIGGLIEGGHMQGQ